MCKSEFSKAEIFAPQTKGVISNSLLQGWTKQAYECYKIGCDCKKCSIDKKKYSFICQMPKVVRVLVENKIKPDLEML